MKHALMATVAFLGIVMLGAAGCSTKAHVQTEPVVVEEMASFEQAEVESKPCTTLEDSLVRAGQLTNSSFSGATQYDGAIRFEFDSSALSADAKTAIDSVVVPLLQTNKDFLVELQGHTDGFGAEAYNFQLGLARARAVMGYLYQEYDVPLQRMNGFSCGEIKPVGDNSLSAGRAENRRVTIVVVE
ncbi:MAG: OmpA family protein [Deltaproteobacteria bacterium]|nr:OmpA family protein [Deltaproteobacteria bacterium]MDH3849885.1 OmpA family protein [Deltaproteobacteria bacterium]